ncbi:MAG: anti-sigma factor family protein [Terriglobales bacterium]
MKISCQEVWREVSNYLEDDLTPELRARIEEHLKGCAHCSAIVDGTRNIVELVCCDRALALPEGFSKRLSQKLSHLNKRSN